MAYSDSFLAGVAAKKAMIDAEQAALEAKRIKTVNDEAAKAGLPEFMPTHQKQSVLLDMLANPERYAPQEIPGPMPSGNEALMRQAPVMESLPKSIADMMITGMTPKDSAEALLKQTQAEAQKRGWEQLGNMSIGGTRETGANPLVSSPLGLALADQAGFPVAQMVDISKTNERQEPSLTTPGASDMVARDAFGKEIKRTPLPVSQEVKYWLKDPATGYQYGMTAQNTPAIGGNGLPVSMPIDETADVAVVTNPDGSEVQVQTAKTGPNKGKVVSRVVTKPPASKMQLGSNGANGLVYADGSKPLPTDSLEDAIGKGAKVDTKLATEAAVKVSLAKNAENELTAFNDWLSKASESELWADYGRAKMGLGGNFNRLWTAANNAIRIESGAAIGPKEVEDMAVSKYPFNPFMGKAARDESLNRLRSYLTLTRKLNDPSNVSGRGADTGGKKFNYIPGQGLVEVK